MEDIFKQNPKRVRCFICTIEAFRDMLISGTLSGEKFEEIQEHLEHEMFKNPHRVRLSCSKKCYDEMMNAVDSIKAGRKIEDKCVNPTCKHTMRMHPGKGYCRATKCKCLGYVETNEELIAINMDAVYSNISLSERYKEAKNMKKITDKDITVEVHTDELSPQELEYLAEQAKISASKEIVDLGTDSDYYFDSNGKLQQKQQPQQLTEQENTNGNSTE